MHVHLDHRNCPETVVLQGASTAVQQFASNLMAEPGVAPRATQPRDRRTRRASRARGRPTCT
ncbi:MAG: hypothetical protein U1F11_11120 [Steroidobacteraceae bacterium]